MKLLQNTIIITSSLLIVASPIQAFEVISAEDINTGGNGTHASINLAQNARTQFLNKLTPDVGTESFEGYEWATPANLELSFPGAGTATLGGNGKVYSIEHVEGVTDQNIINHEINTGRYPSSGIKYWQASAEMESNTTFNINLTNDIAAFGFYAYDLGDFGGDLNLKLYQNGELIETISNSQYNFYEVVPSGQNSGSALFVGIIGEKKDDGSYETFDRIEFAIANNDGSYRDDFGFDDMTIATPQQIAALYPD